MGTEGEKLRVLIPTTAGAVEVLLLTEEDPVIARSVACIGGTTQTADIDAAYHAFVARPTGVIERLFGHSCYRLDVSGRIDAGSSWQLGVLTAHALHAAGRLAQEGEAADCVLWATGTVRAVDLTVGAVSHVHEKLIRSRERLEQDLRSGARVLLVVPAPNASELPPDLEAGLAAQNAQFLEAATVQEIWDKLALKPPETLRNAVSARRHAIAPRSERDAALGSLPQRSGKVGEDASLEHDDPLVRRPGRRRGVPLMVPDPPRGFVERHEHMALLKARLLDSKGGIVALRGAGGFGKTALVNHICHDRDIQKTYGDGVLHVELGEKPDNLIARIADLVEVLTGERSGLQTVGALSAGLAAALGERRYLLVIDDVWREQDLRPFLQGGPNTTRLITTRLEQVLPVDAFRVPVDAMQGEEAVALLAHGLPPEQGERSSLLTLAARLGEWPLQLTLVNGFLRDRVIRGRRPLAQAIADVNRRLDARGLRAFDAKSDAARHQAVDKTLGVSLELLTPSERARFCELAVFPEDTDVPVGICARLWREAGGLDEIDTEDLLQRLFGYSLLLECNLESRTFRLHDVVRRYLLDTPRCSENSEAALHEKLLSAVGDLRQANFDTDGERRYAYAHGLGHLGAAGQTDRLAALLLNMRWMQDKLRIAGPQSLITDYRSFGVGRAQELIGHVLDLSARILARDSQQLAAQMLARLAPEDAEGLDTFLAAASACLPSPCMVPSRPTFTAPGAELRRFEGHQAAVTGLAVLDGRRFLSCSQDTTLRLWEVESGKELRRFEGHAGPVAGLMLLDGGRVVSGSEDKTLRLWDVESGKELRRFEGHAGKVTSLAVLDGQVLSGSEDKTLRLWDVESGQELRRFEGHEGGVTSIAVAGGRILSASDDRTLRLWDAATGQELRRIAEASELAKPVKCLAVLDARRFLSGGSERGAFRLWEESGRELRRFDGARFWVDALAILDERRVVLGTSGYCEIEVWDVETGQQLRSLGGHESSVTAVAVLDDRRVLSCATDTTVRLWSLDEEKRLPRFKGLEWWVASFAMLDNRRVLSGSWQGVLTVWDSESGEELQRFNGQHEYWVKAIAVVDGRRVLSAGWRDGTLRLWSLDTGAELRCFRGHGDGIEALVVVDSRHFLSGSQDKTLRLWEMETAREMRRFEGHEGGVESLAVVDCRVISGSSDKTIRLWDIDTGRELCRLAGHDGGVYCAVALAGRYVVSGSSDNSLRLWDLELGKEVARLEGDAGFTSLAVLPDQRTVVARDSLARLHWIDVRLAT